MRSDMHGDAGKLKNIMSVDNYWAADVLAERQVKSLTMARNSVASR
jgi:hypothetical protein